MISLFGFNPKASWSVRSVTAHTVTPRCADLLCDTYKGPRWSRHVQKLMKSGQSQHRFFGSQSSPLLFLGLLGIRQREAGLRPTHLLSVTLLILVAMQFSLLSIFNPAELVMYEEQALLWRTVCWRQSKKWMFKKPQESSVSFLDPSRIKDHSATTLACTLCMYECLIMCHCPKVWERAL